MQLSLQDIRKLGHQKIFKDLTSYGTKFGMLYYSLSTASSQLSDVKCSAYSLPRLWEDARQLKIGTYNSMSYFLNCCEPLVNFSCVDKSLQRRVRNQWNSILKGITDDLKVPNAFIAAYSDVCLKSCLVPVDLDLITSKFINYSIVWGSFMQSEVNLRHLNFDYKDVLDLLINNDCESIYKFLMRGGNV